MYLGFEFCVCWLCLYDVDLRFVVFVVVVCGLFARLWGVVLTSSCSLLCCFLCLGLLV